MATSTFSSWSLVWLTAANIFNCTSSIFCCIAFPASMAWVSPSRAWKLSDLETERSSSGNICSRISSTISPSPGGWNTISGNTALSTVSGGDFRGEGRAAGSNGETSTEAAGKTYTDGVSVDGTGHTWVVISVKLDLCGSPTAAESPTWIAVCSLSCNQTANNWQDLYGQPDSLLLRWMHWTFPASPYIVYVWHSARYACPITSLIYQ